jgi:murein DD-endopeptidase MepM/ murein hydrolase activator NlpD
MLFAAVAASQTQPKNLDLVLPTDNDALFHGGGPDFYQYVERDYNGEKSTPWEGGQYGFVRDPVQTGGGVVFTRFHEGIDIRCLHRNEHGEPIDEVRAISKGKVVHTSLVPGSSNYGRYIVIEHNWGGSPYYSLYAHLSAIDVRTGQTIERGQHIGIMGYTGEGLNRERAHLHLELNLMLSNRFEAWYNKFHRHDPNQHGKYNGMNLTGLDIARFYLELKQNPSLTVPEFLGKEEAYYKIALPKSRNFELPKRYPWMAPPNAMAHAKSWEVSFTRSGLPIKIEPSERSVKDPEIVWVKKSSMSVFHLTNTIANGPGDNPRLTLYGQIMMRLFID